MAGETKIAFFDTKPYDEESFDVVNREFGFSIKYHKSRLGADTAILTKGYPIVCAFVNDTIDRAVTDELYGQGVRLIAMRCAGYNNIDLKAVYGKIHVVRVPAYSPYAVAEHAAGLILSLNRKIHKAYYRTRDNNFNINGFLGFDMYGKTAGVIGTGKIGRVLIDILKGFKMHVLAYDPFPNTTAAQEQGFEYVDLDTIYKKSDIISLHCPLSKETQHLIDAVAIDKMKEGVMIINTSRGALIDTAALIEGLKAKRIGSAGLDVYEEESEYFFEDFSGGIIDDDILARLLTFPNVLVTSHQAFFTREALSNIAHTTLQNIKDFIDGKPLTNEICYQCGAETCNKKANGKCF
ncbi:MAG: hydroxyacid dehydrogenase [Spirochaetes bacterium GWF1_51_8]|nr:MAG: hydroxyacid dehydrogenase [Spirochaetes bacterium GWF1_51_8]